MTVEGWKMLVLHAVSRYIAGDVEPLDLLALLLNEQDEAREQLRRLGFGCTGMPWPQVVNEIETMREVH